MVWEGGIDYFADLQEVWVQVRGLQPQWCKWPILYQFASALGILLEVDWQGMFQSFFEVVRIKIQCKDHTMIPTVRNFNVLGKLYQIGFTVEGPTPVVAVDDGDDGHQPPHNSEEDSNGQKGSNGEDMDTDKKLEKSSPTPSGLKPAAVKGSSTGAPSSSSLAGLSTKVHEVASAFIEKRNCFQSASKLSPLENEGMEKKKVIDWINARGEDEDSCANLLREMELVQEVDEEIFFLENDKGQSLPIVQGQDAQDKLVSKSSKQWGSVFNTRQSARVLNTRQTVLQMAQQVQKKKNLECPIPAASKLKGLEACPVLDQEVEADLQRSHDGERGSFLSSHLPPASGPLTTDSWLRRQD
uniref:Uncharacterized protein n=1 Tax=Avena sativa TaxID=4498 RepID=A0ACD5W4D7_AVESA